RRVLLSPSATAHQPRAQVRAAFDVLPGRIRRGWRPDELWTQSRGHVPVLGIFCGQDHEGSQARRCAVRAADSLFSGDQPEDRQGTKAENPAGTAPSRRPGDRMIARRTFLIFLGVGALSPARSLFAQQPGKIKRIGLLLGGSRESSGTMPTEEFLRGLRDLGYVEGKDFVVEWRTADNRYDRLPALAAALGNVNVEVIVTSGTPGVSAAQRATKTIPIVAVSFGDPVGDGFAASLSRPRGNVTGLTTMGVDLYAKRLEILLAVAPKVTRVGILVNPDNAFLNEMVGRLRADAQKDGRDLLALNIRAASELEGAFSQMTRQRA